MKRPSHPELRANRASVVRATGLLAAICLSACGTTDEAATPADAGEGDDVSYGFFPGDVGSPAEDDVESPADEDASGDSASSDSAASEDTGADGGAQGDVAEAPDDAGATDAGAPDDALTSDSAAPEDTEAPPVDVVVCDPADPPFCDGLRRMRCANDGSGYVKYPCAAGTGCQDGVCVRPEPNVVLLVDTSDSMDWVDSLGKDANVCFSAACPAWDFPDCDDPAAPLTRIAKTKAFLAALAESPAAAQTHLALARFPQTPGDWGSCDNGYWDWAREVTGDDDAWTTTDGGWLDQHLGEVIAAPLQLGAAAIAPWVDFAETVTPTGQSCVNDWDCPGDICVDDQCLVAKNPELRALGPTPLGKSLFYVGEYLRRHVLVEGRPCTADADCATPSHTCVSGACHDPFALCRPTAVVVVSDGSETEHIAPTDFFHPRVQAKRLRYGLGCTTDADCGAGATCVQGVCRPPATDVDWAAKACEVSDLPCATDSDCADFQCGLPALCQGVCGTAAVPLVAPGADRLEDWSGAPASVTVHVVSASATPDESRLIAAYGGGTYVKTDLESAETLLDSLLPLLDLKAPNPCDPGL